LPIHHRGDKLNKVKGNLPNAITLTNLCLGVMAIIFAVTDTGAEVGNVGLLIPASLLVIVAALTDRFDGKVARMFNATSELGKELDSLSDLISFGVAPIIIAWKMCLTQLGILGYIVTLIFPMAGAYRLARYNITEFDNVYRGIPITIAGALLTVVSLYNGFSIMKGNLTSLHTYVTAILIILLSYLMVSKICFKKI
jgi:CDP-diacylglycerol--serine O-phosphatidyltransferase